MLSLQEISDRFEIQDLLYKYAELIDSQNADALVDIFTEDAYIDYSVYGGEEAKGNRTEIISYLNKALGAFSNTQHLNANMQISIAGDRATGKIMCFNPMEMPLGEGKSETFMLGLYYIDEYVRTEAGWRIAKRVEEKCWKFAVPDFMGL